MLDITDKDQLTPPLTGSSQINVGDQERVLSVAGGMLLAVIGLRKPTPIGIAMALVGGALVFRGASGYCPVNQLIKRDSSKGSIPEAINIKKALTVVRPRNEVYALWRKLENLPRFMTHLAEVTQLDTLRSKWTANIPGNLGTLSWEAEILRDDENRLIKWQSLPGSSVDNSGEIRFEDAPGGRGTEIHAHISYRPPLGNVGKALGKLFNPAFEQLVKNDLRHFKEFIETGEIPTIEGQTSGRSKDKKEANIIKNSTKTQKEYESTLLERDR